MHNLPYSEQGKVEQQLVQFLESERLLNPNFSYVIQAGYFEANPDVFAHASLRTSLALITALAPRTNTVPKVFTLQNDMGPNCGASCEIPTVSAEELDWEVPIIREKTALNRGLRRLRKALKTNPSRFNIVKNGDESIISLSDGKRSSINIAIARGEQLIGLCPLLLASFYEMILREREHDAVLIDFCHYVEVQKVATAVAVLNAIFLDENERPRTVIAAALDSEGNNLNPILV